MHRGVRHSWPWFLNTVPQWNNHRLVKTALRLKGQPKKKKKKPSHECCWFLLKCNGVKWNATKSSICASFTSVHILKPVAFSIATSEWVSWTEKDSVHLFPSKEEAVFARRTKKFGCLSGSLQKCNWWDIFKMTNNEVIIKTFYYKKKKHFLVKFCRKNSLCSF